MPSVSRTDVLDALSSVENREFGDDIVSLGQVADVRVCAPLASVAIVLPNAGSRVAEEIGRMAREAMLGVPGVETANVAVRTEVSGSGTPAPTEASPAEGGPPGGRPPQAAPGKPDGVRNVLVVASGKGGVGKSTVSANLAVALARDGARVGLLDADVYGPSQTTMLGVADAPETDDRRRLVPAEAHGARFISMGMLSGKETPVIWRGPMASRLVQQFFSGVAWGELDYLIVDLPPGTGDVQLTIAQTAALAGAIIVTTPQAVARGIAEKGLRMFQPVRVPVLGIIENMSGFACPHCREVTPVFSTGGGEEVARDLGLPFLGAIPLDPAIVASGDEGVPTVVRDPESVSAAAYRDIARSVALAVARQNRQAAGAGGNPEEMAARDGALEIRWPDGEKDRLDFDYLRNHCPCATCVDEWSGKRRALVLLLPDDFALKSVKPVGNYGVQIGWSDGHDTGIYSYHLLRNLARRQRSGKNAVPAGG